MGSQLLPLPMRCDLKSLQYRRRRRRVSAIIALAIEVKRISSSRRRCGEKKQRKEQDRAHLLVQLAPNPFFAKVFSLFAPTVMCLCLSLLVIAMSLLQNCPLSLFLRGEMSIQILYSTFHSSCLFKSRASHPLLHYISSTYPVGKADFSTFLVFKFESVLVPFHLSLSLNVALSLSLLRHTPSLSLIYTRLAHGYMIAKMCLQNSLSHRSNRSIESKSLKQRQREREAGAQGI